MMRLVRTSFSPSRQAVGGVRNRCVTTASLKTASEKVERFVAMDNSFREICEEHFETADKTPEGKIIPREIVRKSAVIFRQLETPLESASIPIVLPDILLIKELLREAKLDGEDLAKADLTDFTLFFKQVLKLVHYRADPDPKEESVEIPVMKESGNGVVMKESGIKGPILVAVVWTFALFAVETNFDVSDSLRQVLQIGAVGVAALIGLLARPSPKTPVKEKNEVITRTTVMAEEVDPVKELFREEIFAARIVV